MSAVTLGLYLLFGAIALAILVSYTVEELKDYHNNCNHNCNQGRNCNCKNDDIQ